MRSMILVTFVLAACSDAPAGPGGSSPIFRGYHAHTLLLGASDNAEVVKVLPGARLAVLVGSKARKVTLLRIEADRLVELRSRILFANDASESELTHIDFDSTASFAAVTRTIVDTDADGNRIDCRGELVFVDVRDRDSFGEVLSQVDVGPMPDAVDISPDDTLAVVANERDAVDLYGKCAVPGLTPSISIVEFGRDPAAAVETARIALTGDAGREPEQAYFGHDSDLAAVTLQDSQELVLFRVSTLPESPTLDDLTWVALPNNSLGAAPWPDGVVSFRAADGAEYFAVAGEYNDTLTVVSAEGDVVHTVEFDANALPHDIPRGGASDPPLRPDSLAAFEWQETTHIAASLKSSGAVAVWSMADPRAPSLVQVIKIGDALEDPSVVSTIGTEGIGASDEGFIVAANEGESSVSLILPE